MQSITPADRAELIEAAKHIASLRMSPAERIWSLACGVLALDAALTAAEQQNHPDLDGSDAATFSCAQIIRQLCASSEHDSGTAREPWESARQAVIALRRERDNLKVDSHLLRCGVDGLMENVATERVAALERLLTIEREKTATVTEALVKLWKHTPKIDNGRCMVCGVGYAYWVDDGNGKLKVGPCSDERCLSHVVREALPGEAK